MSSVQIKRRNGKRLFKSNWLTSTRMQITFRPTCPQLGSFCTYCSTFAGDGLKPRLDASDRTARAARFTLKEVQSRVFL